MYINYASDSDFIIVEKIFMHILIISFRFPPMEGIGGRRWAKFSKVLAQNGYHVHVITAAHNTQSSRSWLTDIEHNNIHIYHINSNYPTSILGSQKLPHKVLNKLLSLTTHKIDYAECWHKNLLKKASYIIETFNINNVIATSPPFSVAYYSSYLKVQYPHINLIQDFRDNWNDDPVYVYPKGLTSFRQKERLAYMEMFVAHHCDYLLNVTEGWASNYRNKYPHLKDKIKTLYNGFDEEDSREVMAFTKSDDVVTCVYTGSLGLGRIKAVEMLAISLINSHNTNIRFDFYTNFAVNKLPDKVTKCVQLGLINFYDFVSPKCAMQKIANADVCLSINSPFYPEAFGTKVYDYMSLNKRILHISGEGELSQLLRSKGQYVCDYEGLQLDSILSAFCRSNDTKQDTQQYEQFNILNLTTELEALFRK